MQRGREHRDDSMRQEHRLAANELAALEAKASSLGDYILAGHLMRDVDSEWSE